MKIHQIRNATLLIELGDEAILVDPMLAARHALPQLRLWGATQRNPIVELPEATTSLLERATLGLITHCQKGHFDHLDRCGRQFLRQRRIPVICTPHDHGFLERSGILARPLPARHSEPSPFLDGSIRTVRCVHGRGLVGRLMEHGVGYFIALPGMPSLYLAGDTILTDEIRSFVAHAKPDLCVVPAGGARFDVGGEIIMGVQDVIELARLSEGMVIANHLEALSHCPVSRDELRLAALQAGLGSRLLVPEDGETLSFS